MSFFLYLFLGIFLPVVSYFLHWFTIPIRDSFRDPPPSSYTHTFFDPKTKRNYPFPSAIESKNDSSSSSAAAASSSVRDVNGHRVSVSLSVIVPAYNEELRLDAMMKPTLEYLHSRVRTSPSFSFELILVDDGSRDGTTQRGIEYSREYGVDTIRVLTLTKNQGKGGAVQQGMLHARGERLLFCDADGATEFRDLEALEKKLDEIELEQKNQSSVNRIDGGVVVGSRAHYEREAVAQRAWYRNILMYGFHFLVSCLCPTRISRIKSNCQRSRHGGSIKFQPKTQLVSCFCLFLFHKKKWLSDGIPIGTNSKVDGECDDSSSMTLTQNG